MFRKLLRYDLKAVRGLWLGQAAIILAMSIPAGLVMRFLNSEYDSRSAVYEGLATFFVSVYVLWLVGSYIMVQYGIYHHFYKNFYTDEGYLTFTLPVSRKQLLFSKVANAIIWSAAQVLLYLLAALIVLLLSAVPKDGALLSFANFGEIGQLFADLWKDIGAWLIVYLLEGLCLLICIGLYSSMLIYMCITVASLLVKKAKVLAGVALYFLIDTVISGVTEVNIYAVLGPNTTFSVPSLIFAIEERLPSALLHGGYALVGLIACLAVVSIAYIMFCVTLDVLERKLNLS